MIYTTIGYNRWPRNWGSYKPFWERYPNVAPLDAPWPIEMVGRRTTPQRPNPPFFPQTSIMFYQNLFENTHLWQCSPSLLGVGTATRFSRTVIGERDDPLGIFNSMEFFGPKSHARPLLDLIVRRVEKSQSRTALS